MYKNELMCHKIAANNALSVLINCTNQDADNLLKDNCITTTISQDTESVFYNSQDTDNLLKDNCIPTTIGQNTELVWYNARYHKTNEKLKRFVSHQKYNNFKKLLRNLGENLNSSNQDENACSFGMHSIDELSEELNQTHYQS